jgi:hypothetical protein
MVSTPALVNGKWFGVEGGQKTKLSVHSWSLPTRQREREPTVTECTALMSRPAVDGFPVVHAGTAGTLALRTQLITASVPVVSAVPVRSINNSVAVFMPHRVECRKTTAYYRPRQDQYSEGSRMVVVDLSASVISQILRPLANV